MMEKFRFWIDFGGNDKHAGRIGGRVKMGVAVGMMLPQATQRRTHQKLEEAEEPPFEPLEKLRAADTWTSDFWLQNCERIGFCCFIPPSLW